MNNQPPPVSKPARRVRTYIEGFDENIQGGMPSGHIALVSGAAGTMKSSLCFNILYHEALNGYSGIYISLEQSSKSLLEHVKNMGYDLTRINLIVINELATMSSKIAQTFIPHAGKLIIVDLGAIRKEIRDLKVSDNKSWLNVIKNILRKVKAEAGVDLFVLDSLSALYVLCRFENPRIELFYIFEFLRDLGLTTFLISEMQPGSPNYGEYGIEDFLADAIIQVRLTPFRRNVVREISVVKMRATATNNDIFSLEFKNGVFKALYGGQNPLL